MSKRVTLWAIVLLVFPAILFTASLPANTARAAVPSSPATVPARLLSLGEHSSVARVQMQARSTGGAQFLTLPFNDPNILIQNGWVYNYGGLHGGIDYILGVPDTGRWQSFDVVAAADGWACGNCSSRQGNAVWIKHIINGQTYYTYYGHLASIEQSIPVGSQSNVVWVQRGQKIGVAGSTGAAVIHLHFQVNLASGPVDPYDLWSTREPYIPGCNVCEVGPNALWTTNPPSFADGSALPSAPAPVATPGSAGGSDDGGPPPAPPAPSVPPVRPTATATATAVPPTPQPPTATPTPSCTVDFEQTVSGSLSDGSPEKEYCLRAVAGTSVSIRMFATDGTNVDTLLKIYSPSGALLASDDDGAQVDGNSFLVTKLPTTGIYKIVAGRYGGAGTYKLRIEKGAKSALGDLNRDCAVDAADVGLLIDALGSANPNADLNLDGVVDAQDQRIQQLRLGRGCTRQ